MKTGKGKFLKYVFFINKVTAINALPDQPWEEIQRFFCLFPVVLIIIKSMSLYVSTTTKTASCSECIHMFVLLLLTNNSKSLKPIADIHPLLQIFKNLQDIDFKFLIIDNTPRRGGYSDGSLS